MTKYYFKTKSKDRVGCAREHWYSANANSKAEIKRRFHKPFYNVVAVYKEDELARPVKVDIDWGNDN